MKLNFDIIDKVIPSGTIYIENDNDMAFSLFDNRVNFQYAFRNEKQINIEERDNESGIKGIYYCISQKNLFSTKNNGERYTNEEIEAKINSDGVGGWIQYNTPITLGKSTKNIIYAKIVDNNDNVRYINSQGIIVYDDVSAITDVTYTKTTKSDIEIVSDLDKNTIKELRINDNTLEEGETADYTVFDSDGAREVRLNGEYLDSLLAGEHTIVASYNPMVEEFNDKFVEGDKPQDVIIRLRAYPEISDDPE